MIARIRPRKSLYVDVKLKIKPQIRAGTVKNKA